MYICVSSHEDNAYQCLRPKAVIIELRGVVNIVKKKWTQHRALRNTGAGKYMSVAYRQPIEATWGCVYFRFHSQNHCDVKNYSILLVTYIHNQC